MLVLPDIDWSVYNSPDQSESKITEKGLTFTGALIFYCTLLVKTCCQNNAIVSHKSVISVIKIRGKAIFFLYQCAFLLGPHAGFCDDAQTEAKQKTCERSKEISYLNAGCTLAYEI